MKRRERDLVARIRSSVSGQKMGKFSKMEMIVIFVY